MTSAPSGPDPAGASGGPRPVAVHAAAAASRSPRAESGSAGPRQGRGGRPWA